MGRGPAIVRGRKAVVDMVCKAFLHFGHFGVQGTGRRHGYRVVWPWVCVAAWLGGCSPQPGRPGVEESLTSGRITVVCPPEARGLLARERSAFQSLYPQAVIELESGTSRDAVAALFAARCDLAVITRELEPEERAAAVRGRLELEGYRFAKDALAIVVNEGNSVQNMSLQDLARIYAGTLGRWSDVAGSDRPIVPVAQPVTNDVTAFFSQSVLGGGAIEARVVTAANDSAVVARVKADPAAIGYVTLAWADRGARAVSVSSMTGLAYRDPDPEAVYRGEYPLSRVYNFYVRSTTRPLANGFITFVTSRDGQAIVHEMGLVPTSVPVRFVRRSPMLGSH